jgi:hypothetical protein
MSNNNRDYLAFVLRCVGGGFGFLFIAGFVGNNFFPLSIVSLVFGVGFLFAGRWLEQGGQQ